MDKNEKYSHSKESLQSVSLLEEDLSLTAHYKSFKEKQQDELITRYFCSEILRSVTVVLIKV